MFSMLFSCGLLYTVGGIILLFDASTFCNSEFSQIPSTGSAKDNGLVAWLAATLILSFAWYLNLIVHTVFITKYWLISRRIEVILKNQDSSRVDK